MIRPFARRRCRHPMLAAFAPALLAAGLAGCAVGPDYQRPLPLGSANAARFLPTAYKEALPPAAASMVPARAADAQPRGQWWTAFGDPQLDALIAQIDLGNLSLAQAEARYRQAQGLLAQARAGLWPTLGASASGVRSDARSGSITVPGAGTVPSFGSARPSNAINLSLSASWEIDLWGRIRRTIEADAAAAAASAGDLESLRLSLRSQMATSYAALRLAEAQRRMLDETAQAYARLLQITENRYAAGVAAKSDVLQARSQWLAVRGQAVDTGIQRAQLEHAIAVLIGAAPAELSIPAADSLTLSLPQVAPQLPSTLLQRRADIAADERRVAAANAQIGVAQSAFFPTLTLSASGGYRGPTLADLVTLPNRFWSLGPALALSVFDAGARRAAREQAVAAHEQAVATYRQTVLGALQEVEDQLAALRVLAGEQALQVEATQAAVEAAAMTTEQYRAGTVGQINVLTARAAELTARRTLLAVEGQRINATIALFKALGGSW